MIDYSVVLDQNERQRMLEDGYQPDVIDFIAKDRYESMRNEFSMKKVVLNRHYEPVSYFDFVAEVFPGVERLMVITAEDTYQEMDVDELMEYQGGRNDVYVAPATFINGCYKADTCHNIHALVVDIDRIDWETLEAIIKNGNLGGMTPLPSYIVNSGSGVHFYYVFNRPVPFYHKNRNALKEMYRKLCGITKKNIHAKTDFHAITQPFRLPGSQTKLGQTAAAWRSGEKWSVALLARRLNVDTSGMDLSERPLLSQKEYQEAKAQRAEQAGKPKTAKKKWKSSLEGKVGFYRSCLQRCYEETPEGSRYLSMVALTMVAYKVRLPKEVLEEDLKELLIHYNQIGKVMGQKEIKKALRAYNSKADMTPSTGLEARFGWEFSRDAAKRREKMYRDGNRPTLTRAEILEDARAIRDIRMKRLGRKWDDNNGRKPGSGTKQQQIRDWRAANPDGTPKECMAATGISKNTVYKWWKEEVK